ncbi:MAG: GGDEF domain-containing protein [Ruminococcus sp.]|nr:GGDEF domain-containing protein [Ruminococcus sp.]
MEKKITIGLMIHHLDNDYSKSLLKGAVNAAKDLDVNIAVFPGRSLNCRLEDSKFTAFEYQNNVIYSYASSKSLDALIVSAGTVGSFVTKEQFKEFLDGYKGLPLLTMENKVGGYPCVRLSGEGIKELVNHLVTVHGKKNIAFVSGPKGNADADERLGCYISALEENGLEYDPQMVAYGRFSEYCVDLVGELIDRNEGKIDAICFANDMMCKGGYKAIENRGLRIGEDIAVTGYDDSEVAISLKPLLTTVRADASKLGYKAVSEAVRLARGETVTDTNLSSTPVFRFSCGCAKRQKISVTAAADINADKSVEDAVSLILSEHIPGYHDNVRKFECIQRLRDFTAHILRFAEGEDENKDDFFVKSYFAGILDNDLWEVIAPEDLLRLIKSVRDTAEQICRGEDSIERKMTVIAIINRCTEAASERIISLHYSKLEDVSFTHFLIGNITKDMTIYGSDEEKCYFSIVNNLYRAHILSSFIYTYDKPILHSSTSLWELPETVYLKACHDGDKLTAVTGEARKMPSSDIINNSFTPSDRRRTMIVAPLFMNEDQYGVIVCEMENEYFPYIYSITPQICTAIKLTNLVAQLESSLDEAQNKNSMLNRMSMCDELTGIYNRRGFYVYANHILKAAENEGRHGVLIFGDLDNLKVINDTFGHDDGDYAIVSAAGFIKSSLRNSDVVGRIGGDEFAAFAICDDREIMLKLPERIKNIAAQHNQTSGKPYNVTVSVGIYELICSPDHNIQQFMDKADAALYEDKKKKNRNVLKNKE